MTVFILKTPNLSSHGIWDSNVLVSPFFDYSFSVSIGKCSLLPTLEADITQHSVLSLCFSTQS